MSFAEWRRDPQRQLWFARCWHVRDCKAVDLRTFSNGHIQEGALRPAAMLESAGVLSNGRAFNKKAEMAWWDARLTALVCFCWHVCDRDRALFAGSLPEDHNNTRWYLLNFRRVEEKSAEENNHERRRWEQQSEHLTVVVSLLSSIIPLNSSSRYATLHKTKPC